MLVEFDPATVSLSPLCTAVNFFFFIHYIKNGKSSDIGISTPPSEMAKYFAGFQRRAVKTLVVACRPSFHRVSRGAATCG